jgi:peptidoglycan glycosyltransferase
MSRRTTELFLLLAATPVIALLFVLALLNDGKALNLETLAVPAGLVVAFIISHLAIRRLAPNADPALLPIVFVLAGIGIAFVMRLSPAQAPRQVLWLFVGIAAMIGTLILVRSIRKLGNYKYTIMLGGIILLLLPAVIGTEVNGSKIWLTFAGYSFQPGEVAKVLIVLFLAAYLADNREMLSVGGRRVLGINFPDLRTLTPLLLMWAISLLVVVFERDLGSALLFFGIFLIMLYVATGRAIYVVGGAVLAILGITAAWLFLGHVQTRIAIWLDPWADEQNTGYQLAQALYSLADGELFGTGIGRGYPTLIPVVASDFIFVAIAEEMGLLGASGVLMLYVLFAVRGLTIAARARSDVDAFTAVGLTAAISLQAFVIVGGVTQFIPLTGVTLPFMSQGGSSLLASFICVGLLLRAGDSATGLGEELQGTIALDGGVLGRLTLGKRLTFVTTAFCVLFALLIGNLTWHMVINADHVRTFASNNHVVERNKYMERGAIISADGVTLAQSVDIGEGKYQREYPEGDLAAHVVGYSSTMYGTTGVEARYSETLAGEENFEEWASALSYLAGRDAPSNDVQLTVDTRIQRSAQDALSGRQGAAVVLDPSTGAVLAMASSPTYDINDVEEILSTPGDDGTGLGGGDTSLYNRATLALYAPGSTFKMVTLTGALSSGSATLDSSWSAPASLEIGGAPVTNYGMEGFGTLTLRQAFAYSCNTVFAQVATEMGAEQLVSSAEGFGFNGDAGADFDLATSLMPVPREMTEYETAWAGAGQPVGQVGTLHPSAAGPQATVMQMALVAAGIANDGIIMRPYVVNSIIGPEGTIVSQTAPSRWLAPCTPAVAAEVQEAMLDVVDYGTGYDARLSGYTVRGKTGTAQTTRNGVEMEDSWFVGYIELDGRKVVVAVVIEDGASGDGSRAARSIFSSIVEVY